MSTASHRTGLTLPRLVLHNVVTRKLRLALTAAAIAVGVMTVVTFHVVDHSLKASAVAIMQTGRADFTVAQRGVSDLLNSAVDQGTLTRVAADPRIAAATGVLIATTRLDAANPLFLEIGIDPHSLADFGVTVVSGRPFRTDATREVLLGWRAADNLHARAGDRVTLDGVRRRVVGIYSTGQALGDAGAMLPLVPFQAERRQPGQYTLVFVRTRQGASIAGLRADIEHRFPQLVTVRTAEDFGRADRSLALISAADRAAQVLAVLVGAIIVMTTMTMAFIERTREFGVLAAVGWPGRRILAMIMGEAAVIGLLGAAVGVALSFAATQAVGQLPGLRGILHPEYTTTAFWRALWTAAAMSLLGAVHPAARAAKLSPLEALRRE
ncbi:ABC transporter permease [Jatrophihabitans fulvus]